MKAVILAGGFGTRIAEESDSKPKPMVEVGAYPLLWHIMKIYSHHGINDFVICLGYKGYVIKEFFSNYYHHMSDMKIDLKTGEHEILNNQSEDWRITLVDTGSETMTGGRLKRISDYLDNETFCLTYGDGLSDIDITAELAFHREHGKLATIAAVQPPGRFGVLNLDDQSKTMLSDYIADFPAVENRPLHLRLHTLYGLGTPSPFMFLGQIYRALLNETFFEMSPAS